MTFLEDREAAIDIASRNPGTVVLAYAGEHQGRFGVSKDLDEVMYAIMQMGATPIYLFLLARPDPASPIVSTDK